MTSVLILEDEPLIAMDLKMAFEDAGVSAHAAANCERAFELLDSQPILAAILDVNLGHGKTCDGVAVELRKRGIPFVLHTGDLDRRGEHLREIDAPVIPKPSESSYVVNRLLELLEKKAA